jgi:hypothetical protein
MAIQVKTIGSSGQLSFGKKYAGRTVSIEEMEKGVWSVRLAQVIPDNELWLHQEPFKSKLDAALALADRHEVRETDFDAFERKVKKQAAKRR